MDTRYNTRSVSAAKARTPPAKEKQPSDYYARKLLKASMLVAEGASGVKVPQ